MTDLNPYESPPEQRPDEADARRDGTNPVDDDPSGKIALYAQLGLRLIGVMFVVEGSGGIIGSLAYAVLQSSQLIEAGYEPATDAYALGWFAASLAVLVGGIYCVIGGHWLLEKVFLPARPIVEAAAETDPATHD